MAGPRRRRVRNSRPSAVAGSTPAGCARTGPRFAGAVMSRGKPRRRRTSDSSKSARTCITPARCGPMARGRSVGAPQILELTEARPRRVPAIGSRQSAAVWSSPADSTPTAPTPAGVSIPTLSRPTSCLSTAIYSRRHSLAVVRSRFAVLPAGRILRMPEHSRREPVSRGRKQLWLQSC